MEKTTTFLRTFMFDGGLMQISIGNIESAPQRYTLIAPSFEGEVPDDLDVYFSPALRRRKGGTKKDVLGTKVLWVDVDDPVLPDPTIPPSAIVWSGHGFHLYWFLAEAIIDSDVIESYNKLLIHDIPTADQACWNANRLMRVPGTINPGKDGTDETPTPTDIRQLYGYVYQAHDIGVLAKLSDDTRLRIRTGVMQGYASRSERDYAVLRSLIIAEATDSFIKALFDRMPIGDKHREAPSHYLEHSLDKLRKELQVEPAKPGEGTTDGTQKAPKVRRKGENAVPVTIVERDDGYYMVGVTSRRLSTFTLEPLILLDGSFYDTEDAIVCNVKADGMTWKNITFPKIAFTSVSHMDKFTPVAAWHWLGHESDLRGLLPFLIARLKEMGFPAIRATPTLGLHFIHVTSGKETTDDGGNATASACGSVEPVFLGDKHTLTHDDTFIGTQGPITWLPNKREHPKLDLTGSVTEQGLVALRQWLPKINEPSVVWSMTGWYAATCMKPWLETKNYRFPILNITGTKGSGKTTLSQRIMMPLFGQIDAKGYDSGTTKFVQLALLGSSNAVPIAFSEFRADSVEKFQRTILMAYDTGHDPRGRADQTTQDYPLSAPFSVDGEDVINDPAARERIVVARLRPNTIEEGGSAYHAFSNLRNALPTNFAGSYIRFCLQAMRSGDAHVTLNRARDDIDTTYPTSLPDRVRQNYTVALFGVYMFCRFTGCVVPLATVFTESIAEIVNMESGRSRTLVDEFVETMINSTRLHGNVGFLHSYNASTKTFFFNLQTAHGWWVKQRKQQGRTILERDAIREQVKESPYFTEALNLNSSWMYGISIELALAAGLDIPTELKQGMVIKLPSQ